jgi:hypothetical protein
LFGGLFLKLVFRILWYVSFLNFISEKNRDACDYGHKGSAFYGIVGSPSPDCHIKYVFKGGFFGLLLSVHCSTLLHLPPLRFHSAGDYWSVATLPLTARRSNQSARSHPLNLAFEIKGQRKKVVLENLAV